MRKVLTILEVSQKQAYVFSTNKLSECVERSEQIAAVTSPAYMEKIAPDCFSEEGNLVYSGGGHMILEFSDRERSARFCRRITRYVHETLPMIDLFVATVDFEGESGAENQRRLIQTLEKKKARRRASFRQGTFGIERLSEGAKLPVYSEKDSSEDYINHDLDRQLIPDGFELVKAFKDLGGSREESNYIAVIHIDGNGMGKRVEDFYECIDDHPWEDFKSEERKFSEAIDSDYKKAYAEMLEVVASRIKAGNLDKLALKERSGKIMMPVRRIISSGDDVCIVTEGRIGLECAVEFIKALNRKENEADCEGYDACAGVAIVHQKYPFYRAYDIAEALCSNAKKFGASVSPADNGACVSSIDWHLEQGELGSTLEGIRSGYMDMDGNSIVSRPYIIKAKDEILKANREKDYQAFRKSVRTLQGAREVIPRGKVKGLRDAIKYGGEAKDNYIRFNRLDSVIDKLEIGMEYDAVEMMDTFVSLE